ncbi:MAG: PepSY-like domain-containing protein [Adhaeribacter sp.]
MKSKSFLIAAVCATFFMSSCEKEEVVKAEDLPQTAREFISNNFANETVTSVVKEESGKNISYDVVLNNGTKLDFNKEGQITEIDSQTKLPDSVIPGPIRSYVQTNYATEHITGWELEGTNQDVELSNQLELRFDKDNNFVSLQD